jgi:hypothetical protein
MKIKSKPPPTAITTIPLPSFSQRSRALPVIQDLPADAWDLYRDGVTQGWLGAFNDCPQKALIGLVHGLSFKGWTGGALEFGTLFHELLDAVYSEDKRRALSPGEEAGSTWLPELLRTRLDLIYQRETTKMHQFPPADPQSYDKFEENFGLVRIMIYTYFMRWKGDFGQYQWVDLEQKFNVPYPTSTRLKSYGMGALPDVPLRGKMDGVYKVNSKMWLFETKTKGQINEDDILDGLSYNLQVQVYLWAIRQLYQEVPEGVLYNIVRRPMLRRTAKESLVGFLERVQEDVVKRPDHYFIRYHAVILPEEQKRWVRELDSMMLRLILWYQGIGHFRNASACKGRWGRCGNMRYCGTGNLMGLSRREHLFPELVDGGDEDVVIDQ